MTNKKSISYSLFKNNIYNSIFGRENPKFVKKSIRNPLHS